MKVATLNAKIKRYHLDTDALIHAASNIRRPVNKSETYRTEASEKRAATSGAKVEGAN
jgi:hypothetical protein